MAVSIADGSTYADGRVIDDCDAHIMEPPGWLASFAPTSVADRLPVMDMGVPEFTETIARGANHLAQRRSDPAAADAAVAEFMTMPRKGWGAFGDHDPVERTATLDLLGFRSQVVFPTGSFAQALAAPDDIFDDAVMAMNRGMAAFCDTDPRLLAVAYIPFRDNPETALRMLAAAIDDGAATVMIDMVPRRDDPSHTHPDFDPVWAAIAEADLTVMLHIGLDNAWKPLRPSFFNNGRELPNFRSDAPGDALSYLAIGYPAELFIGSMVFDGVLDRHPNLRFISAELGATWVPSYLHFIDNAARSFRRLQDLSHLTMSPSDYVRRHFCFSPFAGEDVGFMIDSAGPELFLFSSDYPHHEGTDDPIGRFERTMENVEAVDDDARDLFYSGNFRRQFRSPHLPA